MWSVPMAAAMARQKQQGRSAQRAAHHRVGGGSVRGLDLDPLHVGQRLEIIKPAATDDAENFVHARTSLCQSTRKKSADIPLVRADKGRLVNQPASSASPASRSG